MPTQKPFLQKPERHRSDNVGWLRAAVMGANDGIVSTASLIVGVAAAQVSTQNVLVAGVAGLVAGAMSMAAGEYVSVCSQRDTERADIELERRELEADPAAETAELAEIYIKRGLSPELARQVADQLMKTDALGAHVRDELGITESFSAQPVQAALASAATFAVGAVMPLAPVLLVPREQLIFVVSVSSLIALGLLGGAAAKVGGANSLRGATRVVFWGALAMALTAAVGHLVGTTI